MGEHDARNAVSGSVVHGPVVQVGVVHGDVNIHPPAPNAVPTPSRLPPRSPHFTGRVDDVRRLSARLRAHDPSGREAVVCLVDGMPGVGKTELVVHVGHEVAHHFPDGTVFLDLAGYSPGREPVPPVEALRLLLGQRGVPADQVRQDETTLRALWRGECAAHRLLVVLDNARDSAQVAPLLPGVPSCAAVVTSREKLIGLASDALFPLEVLSAEESVALFSAAAGVSGADAAVRRVVELCGRLPLAVGIAASMIAHQAGYTPTELADDLAAERRYLDDLHEGDGSLHVAVHASIRLSYRRHLPAELVRAFQACGWHPGPEVTAPALAAMLARHPDGRCVVRVDERDVARSERSLRALAARNLIRPTAGRRYRVHDLVRASARLARAELSFGDGVERERSHALDHLLHVSIATVERAESWRYGGRLDWRQLRPDDTPLRTFTGLADAVAWILLERDNLLALIDSVDHRSSLMSGLLAAQLHDRGFLADARRCYQDAESGYAHMGLDTHRAHAIRGLAAVAMTAGDHDSARRDYLRARRISRRLDDPAGHALALRGLGTLARMLDDYDRAAACLHQAISLFVNSRNVPADDPVAIRHHTLMVAELAEVEKARGNPAAAVTLFNQALLGYATVGDVCARHNVLTSLAGIMMEQGDHDEARAAIDEVLHDLAQIHDPRCAAKALWQRGQLEKELGDPVEAIATYERVLVLERDAGSALGVARGLLGLADAERLAGRLAEADGHFRETQRQCQTCGDRAGMSEAYLGLGDVAAALGDRSQADRHWERALGIATEIGSRFMIWKAESRIAGTTR